MSSTSLSDLLRLQNDRFAGQALLPILLGDPNLRYGTRKADVGAVSASSRLTTGCSLLVNPDSIGQQWDTEVSYERLPRKSTDRKDASNLRQLLRRHWCPQAVSCDQLVAEADTWSAVLSTGASSLDNLLGGGIRTGEITEVIGKSATGKTQLSLRTSASLLLSSPQATVLYIDTKGDFNVQRLCHLLLVSEPSGVETVSKPPFLPLESISVSPISDYLQRIRHVLAPDPSKLVDVLVETRLLVAKARGDVSTKLNTTTDASAYSLHAFMTNLRLVIIDSLAMPYLPFMGCLPQSAKSHLALVAAELQRISLSRPFGSIAVLVINHARGERPSAPRGEPSSFGEGCLGRSWAGVPRKRVFLRQQSPTTHDPQHLLMQAALLKSNNYCCCSDRTSLQWSDPFEIFSQS